MTKYVEFTKMHGAGNDYIYVNTLLYDIPNPSKASVAWSKEHFGIGSDGLVLICPPDIDGADYRMRIFNADGSEAMMCGNASRCIGKYLYEKGLTDKQDIRLETASGIKTLHLHVAKDDKENHLEVDFVTVDMLEPCFSMPKQFTGRVPVLPEGCRDSCFVSMGNPHFVLFMDHIPSDEMLEHVGRQLENNTAFPERCNIEFAVKRDTNAFRTRVWERGSGITMACGTGACATASAAIRLGMANHKVPIEIEMDGGKLHIEMRSDNHIYMSGPASFVYDGKIVLP